MWGRNSYLAGALVPVVATLILIAVVTVTGGRYGSAAPAFPDAADGAVANCLNEAVRPVGRSEVRGHARLCLSQAGIQATMDLENLSVGVTYSAWLGYFSDQARCSSSPCGTPEPEQEDAAGLFERLDSALPDLARRASLARGFREIYPRAGAQLHLLVFQHGLLGRMHPSDRIRLLIAWPVTAGGSLTSRGDDRGIHEPLVGRAIIKLLESPETSDAERRSVAQVLRSIDTP
jgi:hypothetical protein